MNFERMSDSLKFKYFVCVVYEKKRRNINKSMRTNLKQKCGTESSYIF